MRLPPQEVLCEILRYDPDTGELFWRERDVSYFDHTSEPERICYAWNQRFAGKRALTAISNKGYCRGTIFDNRVIAHRVIWKMLHGTEPEQIDHKSGIKSDNRLCNLRAADQQINQRNRPLQKNNKSGVVGVTWYKPMSRWVSHIRVDKHLKSLGYFHCIAHAARVRKRAERDHDFHANHGRWSNEVPGLSSDNKG